MIITFSTTLISLVFMVQVPANGTSACLDVIDARFRSLAAGGRLPSPRRIEEVKDACSIGDKAAWQKIRAMLTNDITPRNILIECIPMACEIADEEIARDFIGIVRGWLAKANERMATPAGRRWGDPPTMHAMSILFSGAGKLEGIGQLQAVMTDCEPAFTLTAEFYETGFTTPPRIFHWAQILEACNGPKAQRQAFALSMLRDYPIPLTYASVVSLDDPDFREGLRKIFREPANNQQMGGGISAGAAATLAYLGDEEILDNLKSLRAPFKDNPTMRLFIKHSIQKIELQHPPKNLLEYIASDEDPYADVRAWAIERAVELGLPKSEIRDSILARAQHCDKKGGSFRPNMRPEMIQLRRIGISLGVLKSHDLPMEDVPPSRAVD